MLEQLLSRLRSSLQLPECLRTMGYLRRIAAFSEADLRLQFLRCRWEPLRERDPTARAHREGSEIGHL